MWIDWPQRLRQITSRYWQSARVDWPLLLSLMSVGGLGLLTLYSAGAESPRLVANQAVRLGLGFAVLLVFMRIPPPWFRTITPWFYAITTLLLVLVLVIGEGRGADRWLDFGFIRFQPSELAKLAMPMMIAWYFHARALPPTWLDLAQCTVLLGLPALLIAKQPDLGTALLVVASGAFAVFLAGLGWRRIVLILGLAVAAMPLLWMNMHEYQRNRVRMFLDPEADPLGNGWNIIQSQIAVGSGGLFGKGWMHSTQARLDFLPEHTTDFIFAVYAEEFGLFGVLMLIALYLFIIARGLWIAAHARDTWSRLVAGAISMTFFVYVMVNGGMVSGLLPVVGVPMPLVSYGGTSAVSLLAAFGILLSIHSHRRKH
jgi:rod shape determining protein RodA